jgi:hypothetical protein
VNYTTHASVAARVRRNKEAHPETYCADRICLWNTRGGEKPCPKHPAKPAPILECVACGDPISSSEPSFPIDAGFGRGGRCHETCRGFMVSMDADEYFGDPPPEPHVAEWPPDQYKPWMR